MKLETLFPILIQILGEADLGKVGAFYRKYKGVIDVAFNFLIGVLLKKKKSDEAAQAPVKLVGTPAVTPPVSEYLGGKKVTQLIAKWYFFEKGGKVIPKELFDRIVRGETPANFGWRLHIDITPIDQFGNEIGPGDPALAQLLDPSGYPLMQHNWYWDSKINDGPINLSSEYDDFGCTPVLKLQKVDDDDINHSLTYVAKVTIPGQREIVSNELPKITVRWWKETE